MRRPIRYTELPQAKKGEPTRWTLLSALLVCCGSFLFPQASAIAGNLVLFDGTRTPVVSYFPDGEKPIAKAAELLAGDLHRLTLREVAATPVTRSADADGVLIGRVNSPSIAALLRSNHIDTHAMTGKWET
jgi:hypothetical protein